MAEGAQAAGLRAGLAAEAGSGAAVASAADATRAGSNAADERARGADERAPDAAASLCPECREALAGDYCHRCGEKRPEARDLSVRHFVREAAQELTSLDSKFLRTLAALLFRPGLLTCEWIRGRRGRYVKPLNLCLAIFALNLFVFTASKQVSMFDVGMLIQNERQMAEQWGMKSGGVFARRFEQAAARRNVSPEALAESINDKWQRNFSLSQMAQIILLALLLQIVYIFSRRFFVEHLVFSLHFLSFTALTVALMWPVYYAVGVNPTRLNMVIALAKFVIDILYLFVALRAVYSGSSALALLRALVVFVGYFAIYVISYTVAMAIALAPVFSR